jgi:hypothetical protein
MKNRTIAQQQATLDRASELVEKNWIMIWRRLNSGGLIQHQSELVRLLAAFRELEHLSESTTEIQADNKPTG